MRRFTRLTNGFSKKIENLAHVVSLHYMYCNFARPHATLTKQNDGRKTTPAMAAGVANHVWTCRASPRYSIDFKLTHCPCSRAFDFLSVSRSAGTWVSRSAGTPGLVPESGWRTRWRTRSY